MQLQTSAGGASPRGQCSIVWVLQQAKGGLEQRSTTTTYKFDKRSFPGSC